MVERLRGRPEIPDEYGKLLEEDMDSTQGNNTPKTNIDLSLVSFEEIWLELCRRYDHCCFVGIIQKNSMQYLMTRKYKGFRAMCVGLLSNMISLVNKEENESLGPVIEH